jgi:hypothetical protein
MWVSSGHVGACYEFDINKENVGQWCKKLWKTLDEKCQTGGADFWAQLANKGYQGAAGLSGMHIITPKKAQQNHLLLVEEKAANHQLMTDWIMMKNFYSQLKNIWVIMWEKWRGDW